MFQTLLERYHLFLEVMMKKIYIACSKWNYFYIESIKNRLEQMGYQVILPNFIEDSMMEERIKKEFTKEDHIAFCRNSFLQSQEKVKNSDAIFVLNKDKIKDGVVYPNYIGGATFLEIYDSYLCNHPIFLYHDIPEGMLYDELEGMNPIILQEELFDIFQYDDFSEISKENHFRNYFTESDCQKIKDCEDHYLKAAIIVRRLFEKKRDKENHPYIEHLQRVSNRFEDHLQIAGLLHDIIEDTEITCKDLLELGFPLEIIEVIFIVTKEKRDSSHLSKKEKLLLYEQEIENVINSRRREASLLKEVDMSDNFQEDRLQELPKEKQEWFSEKYGKQLMKLKKVNQERNQKLC